MPKANIVRNVRTVSGAVGIIDIQGEVTAFAEELLNEADAEASANGLRVVMLNFSELEYMNSGGIGLLITMLIRARQQGRKLLAYGLNEHYRRIFEITRLNEAISVYDSEAEALAAAL